MAADPEMRNLQEALQVVLKSELGQLGEQLKKAMDDLEERLEGKIGWGSARSSFPAGGGGGGAGDEETRSVAAPQFKTFRATGGYLSEEVEALMREEQAEMAARKMKSEKQKKADEKKKRSSEGMVEVPGLGLQVPRVVRPNGDESAEAVSAQDGSGDLVVHPFAVIEEEEQHMDQSEATAGTNSMDGPPSTKKVSRSATSIIREHAGESATMDDIKALRMTSRPSWTADFPEMHWRDRLKMFVQGQSFEGIVSIMIFASAAHVGLQTDWLCRNLSADEKNVPFIYRVLDITFMIFFTGEVAMRLIVHGRSFFYMWGWGWNCFDFLLVVGQMFEESVQLLGGNGHQQSALPSAFLLRFVRVLRCVRTVRLLQVMRFADELRLLVSCILHSMKAFSWSLALIVMMVYMASVYFALGVQLYRVEHLSSPVNSDEWLASAELGDLAGNVPLAALSLFQGLTGGMDWNDMAKPMMDNVGWYWGPIFFFYISFMFFAVLNVVTAIFVENAIERSETVKQVQKLNKASRLFKSLDLDGSGQITCEEIMGNLDSGDVQEFFRSIDVHASEAKSLFELMDTSDGEGDGGLDLEEFLSGCMRLQGPARSVDLVRALNELKQAIQVIAHMMPQSHHSHGGPKKED